MEIFKMFGSILVENDPANKAIDETDKKSKKLADTLGSVVKGAALVGGAVVAAGGAMFGAAKQAADYASDINDMSARVGIGTDKLQELKFVSEQTGVNFNSVTNAVGKLTREMDAARAGTGKAAEAFSTLGVEVTNSDGTLKSMDETFPVVLQRLADMENKTDRNALALQLFGKGGMELVPILEQGGLGIEEMSQKARDLGLVMDESAIAAGDQFGDTLDQLTGSLKMVGMDIGVTFMPIIQRLMDWVVKNMPAIKETFSNVFGTIKDVSSPVITAIRDEVFPALVKLYEWVKPYLPIVKDIFKTTFGVIGDVIRGVFGAIDTFIQKAKAVIDWAKSVIDAVKSAWSFIIGSEGTSSKRAGSRAYGGPVASGSAYLVGENGPETFIPNQPGTIVPNARQGINIVLNNPTILDDYGVDRLMERITDRMAVLGV